jgi:hypothetical protein
VSSSTLSRTAKLPASPGPAFLTTTVTTFLPGLQASGPFGGWPFRRIARTVRSACCVLGSAWPPFGFGCGFGCELAPASSLAGWGDPVTTGAPGAARAGIVIR